MTREEGKLKVEKLVNDFFQNEPEYLSKAFQETEARNRFIDPFFEALGWDFHQTDLRKEAWDVHREFSQKDNSSTKKPDYAFRVKDGLKHKVKFFVEAKAPWVKLSDFDPVYQAKRYAFSSHGKTPIVILMDFQEFRVFNGLEKPIYKNPLQGLIKGPDIRYPDYLEKWDAIWDIFSKEAVLNGSIEKLIGNVSKNTKTLDDLFLADISDWRDTLARNIAIRNKHLSVEELNEAVQRIIDRLIFIRNLEDRQIESEDTLLTVLQVRENIYARLTPLFRNLNESYNGLLFKPHFSEALSVDDSTIKELIKSMCYPISPYRFDEIEPEILGRIYERFLGSKIRLTKNHQAKVEVKPEVRHSGGVYYTPQHIVDYIVENTVGVILNKRDPDEISFLKICDPACGSGSFLLGAYQCLMTYHKAWYQAASQRDRKKYKTDFYFNSDGEIQLTLKKKSEILRKNIYGVDIDREATEVAIMSLYLKLLDEGYDKGQAELFMKGHILPDMTQNLKCGNSLIESDYYQEKDLRLFADSEIRRVNVFDWERQFTEIFKANGFDVVIGNPPYVSVESMPDAEKEYYKTRYETFFKRGDLFSLFVDLSTALLSKKYVSFIVPSVVLNNLSYQKLRERLLSKRILKEVCYTGGGIFKDVTVDTVIITIDIERVNEINLVDALNFEHKETHQVDSGYFSRYGNNISIGSLQSSGITDKIFQSDYDSLEKHFDVFQGIVTGNNDAYIFENEQIAVSNKIEERLLFPLCHGRDIQKWIAKNHERRIMYLDGTTDIYKYPGAEKWLNQFKKVLEKRRECKNGVIPWYSLQWPRNRDLLLIKPKIAVQNTRNEKLKTRIVAAIDDSGYFASQGINFVIPKSDTYSVYFLLGLLNSKLINYLFRTKFLNLAIKADYLKQMKLPPINSAIQDTIAKNVEIIVQDSRSLSIALSENDQKMFSQKIQFLTDQNDSLVYKLYRLSGEESEVVDEG